MRRATALIYAELTPTVLTALTMLTMLIPPKTAAGVAPPPPAPHSVRSCPAVIKNSAVSERMMSDDGLIKYCAVDAAGAVDAFNAVDNAGIVDNDNTVSTVDIVNTVNTVKIVDTAGTVDTVNAVKNVDTADAVDNVGIVDTADIDTVDTVGIIDTANVINTVNAIDTDNAVDAKDIGRKPSWIKKNMKFGRRAAFNHSQATNVVIRIYKHDGENFSYSEYRNQAGFGIGFEAAGVAEFAISDALALNASPGVVFRKPINTAVAGTSEAGLSFPVLLEWGPFGSRGAGGGRERDVFANNWADGFDLRNLRLFGGVWAGVPVFARVKWNGEKSAPFKDRASADFGIMCGAGVYVSDRAFVDARGTFGISKYDSARGRRLNQAAIGVNYVK